MLFRIQVKGIVSAEGPLDRQHAAFIVAAGHLQVGWLVVLGATCLATSGVLVVLFGCAEFVTS